MGRFCWFLFSCLLKLVNWSLNHLILYGFFLFLFIPPKLFFSMMNGVCFFPLISPKENCFLFDKICCGIINYLFPSSHLKSYFFRRRVGRREKKKYTQSIGHFDWFDLVQQSFTTLILCSSGVCRCKLGLNRFSKARNYLGSWFWSRTCFFELCKLPSWVLYYSAVAWKDRNINYLPLHLKFIFFLALHHMDFRVLLTL